MSTNLATTVVDGWTLATDADEPRVRDVDLAERLAYDRPRKIRDLIKQMIDEREITGVHVRPAQGRTSMPRGGERTTTVDEYWLTEEQAMLVASRSNTLAAADVRRTLVRVFIAYRRGTLAPVDHIGSALTTLAANTMALTTMIASVVSRLDAIEGRAAHAESGVLGVAGARRIRASVKQIVETHTATVDKAARGRAGVPFRSAEYTALRTHIGVGLRPRLELLPADLLMPALNFLDGRLADARRAFTVATAGKQTGLPFDNVSPIRLTPDAAE